MATKKGVAYPYMPENGTIDYVPADNPFMVEAKEYARIHSLDKAMPNASLIVKSGKVIGRAANGSTYHETHLCERVRLGIPTGQGYELCEGCHPNNHSEQKAIANALQNAHSLKGAELYLWGHWWCCEPCWQNMLRNDISRVHLLERSEVLFDRSATGNIVGKQFA